MIAFPAMLIPAAKNAGISYPQNVDDIEIDSFKDTHPHFWVYCILQLGRAIRWGEQWENAKVVAGISDDRLKTMTLEDFAAAGFVGIS